MTGDERVQGKRSHYLKQNVDQALEESGHEVEQVFVASRTEKKVPMTPGRDVSLEKVISMQVSCDYEYICIKTTWNMD